MAEIHGPGRLVTDGLLFHSDSANHISYPGSGTVWTDLITRTVGTMTNVTVNSGIFNFDSLTSKVSFGVVPPAMEDLWTGGGTMQAWIRPETDGELSVGRVYETRDGVSEGTIVTMKDESVGTMKLEIFLRLSTGWGIWTTTLRGIIANVWNNVVITFDSDSPGTLPIMYMNGYAVAVTASGQTTGTIVSDTGNILVVGADDANAATFDGDIAMLSFYSRELSAAQVLQNFEAGRMRFGV